MKKIIMLCAALFAAYMPSAYAVNYTGTFSAYLTKISFGMGATYGGDVLLLIDTAQTPASVRTFNSGQVCDGLWLPKSDPGSKNALSAAFLAMAMGKMVKFNAQDDKAPGQGAFYCMVYSMDVVN